MADSTTQQPPQDVTEKTKQKMHQDPTLAQKLAADPAMRDTVVDIEKELLEEIIKRLDQNIMSKEQAQKLAKEFLEILPIHDKKDLLEKLSKLSQTNKEITGIYLEYAKPHEENDRQQKLTLMSQHLQEGNIDQALAVAKGGQNA